MKIVCDSCGAKYSIADEKVAGKIFKIRCKKCSSVLEVRGDQAGAHPFADNAPSGDAANEATWYIVVDGEQKGPLPANELSRLFAKGSVGLDSYVWKEGFGDWKVASEVPELKDIFGGAASQSKDGSDDTSSFGTSGDLFSSGREPTSEIDTESSMVTGFDDASTPTTSEAEEAPLAAASAVSETATTLSGAASPGPGGAGVAAASPQRMTGQRNENSVLFSLSNLQQLASQGGPQPTPAQPAQVQPASVSTKAGSAQASGEGSGLIDIRALAQSTASKTEAGPTQTVDDLLAIGAGTGGGMGTPLLGPAPLETSDSKRWLWVAGAAVVLIAIVGAGIGVGMALGGSEDDALEVAAPSVQQPASAPRAAPVNPEPAAAPEPEEPAQEAAVVDIEPEEPAEAATLDPKPASEERPSARQRNARRQRAQKNSSSERQARASQPPKRKSNNLDALMDEVVGGSSPSKSKSKPASSTSSGGASLQDSPSRNDVKTALQGVSGAVKSCRKDTGGTAIVDVVFSGKTGRVSNARVTSGPFKGTPVGACITNAVERARVPRFKQSSFKVTFPYRL